MNNTSPVFLTLDVGTSSVKATLISVDGELVTSTRESLTLQLPKPGWAEQSPEDWWQAMCKCTRYLQSQAQGREIVNLTISAQPAATIAVDKQGATLAPAMIWLDSRSYYQASRLMSGFPKINGYGLFPLLRWLTITNGAPSLAGKDPLSKIIWLREQRPDLWDRVHKLLDVKDYLLFRLTGRYVTTPDCAHLSWLFDSRIDRWQWSETLLNKIGLSKDMLPDIIQATDIVEKLSADIAEQTGLPIGLSVIAGSSDVTANALGSGAIKKGESHIHIGTSSWTACHLPHRKVDVLKNIATLASMEKNNYLLIAAQESAGACMEWGSRNLYSGDQTIEDVEKLAHNSSVGSNNLVFLPWLYGERNPIDDAHIRGGFINLSLSHTRADMVRAIMEGVAMNIAWAYQGLIKNGASASGIVPFVGGGAHSHLWATMLSQLIEQPIAVSKNPDITGVYGAAICASIAAGYHANAESAKSLLPKKQVIEAKDNNVLLERLTLFKEFYRRNHSWFKKMNNKEHDE
jgi:xylulokinase